MRFLNKLRDYIRISKVGGISRRYFVMNAFDGAMTVLGIVIAAYFSGMHEPSLIVSAGLGASVAMGISGFSGAYMTEESEKNRKLNTLEKYMLKKLDNTMIGRANKFASLWAAIVDGLSPALAALIVLIPFFLSMAALMPMVIAMQASISLTFLVLFFLGAYLGKISHRNMIVHGLKIVLAGFAVAVVLFLLKPVV